LNVRPAQPLERPGAVLATAPGQKRASQAACGTRSGV
jgi:hypothetical protein